MAVTITLDDHVAKSVERALVAAHEHARTLPRRGLARDLAVALDVLAPAIVEAEGRRERETQPAFDPHAINVHDALDDGWGNDDE